mgnify:CR=1 FL=1
MTVDNKLPSPETELAARIVRLKKEKGAVILAHYYTLPEVQRIADFTGDSLALSQQAARTEPRDARWPIRAGRRISPSS